MTTTNKTQETKDVQTFFDSYASDFDSIYGHTTNRSLWDKLADKLFRKVMMLRFQETLKHTAKPEIQTVLDVGCGPGHYCVEFLKQGKKVAGLDMAENMLKIAREKVKQLDKGDNIDFIKADYLEHEFDRQFDAACLMGFFDYIKDPVEILQKLKKDIRKEFYGSFPKNGGLLAFQRRIRYRLRNCPLYLYSKNDVLRLMEKAGLKDKMEIVDCERDYFVKITLS